MTTYEDVIEAAISKVMETMGKDLTLRLAGEVEGLEVDDDGSVKSFEGSGKKTLDELIGKYENVLGSVAVPIIARGVSDFKDEDIDLPDRLKEKM